jgi:hypothetical protein
MEIFLIAVGKKVLPILIPLVIDLLTGSSKGRGTSRRF